MSRLPMKTALLYAGFIAAAFATCNHASADVVILKNGTRLEGQTKRTAAGWSVVSDSGASTDVPADSVASIEVGPHPRSTTGPGDSIAGSRSATAAEENLASLRRSVENISSASTAIERYRRFIEQSGGTTAANEARADLAIWQDRQDRGLVKVGNRWVTLQEKADMAAHADATARDAGELLEQNRVQEAQQVIQSALDADPQNASALYLRGLILFGKDQVVASRKAFEAMLAAAPDSGAGLNNLAVILWRQNQPMGALQDYDRGILAWPVRKAILDNVAEALAAVPADQQKNPITLKLQRHFAEQDAQLQMFMAKSGQYRWGATWVDQQTLDKLKAAEKTMNDTLTRINTDGTAAQSRIAEIDRLSSTNIATMTQLQSSAFSRDAEGHVVQLPLPPAFYTLQNENERMASERAALQTKIQQLSEEAKKARQAMPVPPYTGLQRMIGPGGMPAAATTQPTPWRNGVASTTEPATGPSTTTAPTGNLANNSGDLPSDSAKPNISISIGPATAPPAAAPPATQPSMTPTTAPSTQPVNAPVLIPLP